VVSVIVDEGGCLKMELAREILKEIAGGIMMTKKGGEAEGKSTNDVVEMIAGTMIALEVVEEIKAEKETPARTRSHAATTTTMIMTEENDAETRAEKEMITEVIGERTMTGIVAEEIRSETRTDPAGVMGHGIEVTETITIVPLDTIDQEAKQVIL